MVATMEENLRHQISKLRSRLREAEEKVRVNDCLATVGMTAATLAHEIANSLQWIFAMVQWMQRDLSEHQATGGKIPQNEQLELIYKEIKRLRSMLREFHSLARPVHLNIAAVAVRDLIAEVEKIVLPESESVGVRVEHHISRSLPLIKIDAEKLKQVFFNLYKNAIEAMPSGGKLVVKAYPEAENLMIEIRDTGVGIPEGVDIFRPFATTKEHGTGLGLMVVKQIVTAHGGAISCRSKKRKSTTFRIVLPLSTGAQSG